MDLCSVCFTLLACVALCFGQNLVLPDNLNGEIGESITFTPISLPPPPYRTFSWAFDRITIVSAAVDGFYIIDEYVNRSSFNINTLSFTLRNLIESDAGTYILSINSDRAETSLQIFVKISGVTLTGSADVVTEGNPFNLTCEGSGDITDIEWKKDDHPLSAGDGITFSPDKKTLMINPVKRKDRGEYQCTISNPISSGTAKYSVTVNFGPDNLRIDGPSEVKDGETLKLSCITESTPKPSYKWTFNESSTQVTTEVFTVEKVSVNNSGTYTCTASNQVTELNASGSHVLVVKVKKAPGDGGLSGGAIAGIVIGVLLGLAAVAGLSFYFVKTKQKPKTTSSTDKSSRGAQMQGEPELNYAAIQHSQNNWRQYGRSSVNREKRNQGMGMTNQAAPPISDVHIIYSEVRK